MKLSGHFYRIQCLAANVWDVYRNYDKISEHFDRKIADAGGMLTHFWNKLGGGSLKIIELLQKTTIVGLGAMQKRVNFVDIEEC